jgi:thioesterase domain-containing protein
MLREAASLIGLDVAQFGNKPVDFNILFDAANRAGHIPPDFDQKVARRTLQMMKHNAILEREFRARPFDGDILFFFAARKTGEYRRPEAWKPFVTGNIEVHTIDCRHGEMTEPVPLKEIGRILEQHLRALAPLLPRELIQPIEGVNNDEPIRQ